MSKEAMKLALEALEIVKIHFTQNRHVNEAITALREALAEQPAQRKPLTEWQPIETAPKGPTILLYSPNLKEFSMRYRNINVAWWVSTQITEYWGTAVFFDGRSHVQHIHNPTHWMPLPDVPAAHGIKENT